MLFGYPLSLLQSEAHKKFSFQKTNLHSMQSTFKKILAQ